MAQTTFSGPVTSTNGFNGAVGGTTPAAVSATTLTTSGTVVMDAASLTLTSIPTSDPGVSGRIWSNSGVLTVSAG